MSITSICLFVVGIILTLCSMPYKKKWESVSPEKAIMGWAVLFVCGIILALCSIVLDGSKKDNECKCNISCECSEDNTVNYKE